MPRIILDTNALMLFGEGFDLFSAIEEAIKEPCELIIPQQVHKELLKLASKNSKEGLAAKLALSITKERLDGRRLLNRLLFPQKGAPLKIVSGPHKHADDAIVMIAEGDDIVCTLDKALQRRLKVRLLRKKGKKLELS